MCPSKKSQVKSAERNVPTHRDERLRDEFPLGGGGGGGGGGTAARRCNVAVRRRDARRRLQGDGHRRGHFGGGGSMPIGPCHVPLACAIVIVYL